QELEHELLTGSSTVIRKSLESRSLPLIESSISLGVEAHQRLGEGRLEGLDVLRECVGVFELELVRTAFFRRQGRHVSISAGVAQDVRTELLIHQNARDVTRHSTKERLPESAIDHPFAVDPRLPLVH